MKIIVFFSVAAWAAVGEQGFTALAFFFFACLSASSLLI
jgi:hypothetical protein